MSIVLPALALSTFLNSEILILVPFIELSYCFGGGIVYLLTVQVSLFTCSTSGVGVILFGISSLAFMCHTVTVFDSIAQQGYRFSSQHCIRFFSLLKAQVVVCFLCVHYNINCLFCQEQSMFFCKISPTISLAFS
jgi:hypothetical protein